MYRYAISTSFPATPGSGSGHSHINPCLVARDYESGYQGENPGPPDHATLIAFTTDATIGKEIARIVDEFLTANPNLAEEECLWPLEQLVRAFVGEDNEVTQVTSQMSPEELAEYAAAFMM